MNHFNKRILFFDGACILCNGLFKYLYKRDRNAALHFGLIQDDRFDAIISSLPEKFHFILDQKFTSVIFLDHGKVYLKSTAAIKSLSSLGGLYSLAKIALIIPKFIRDSIYDLIAKHRYKWFGIQTCLVPDSNIKDRFI